MTIHRFFSPNPVLARAFVGVALLAAACSTTPPPNVACPDSEQFRLEVQTAPLAEMLLGVEAEAEMIEGTVEGAIISAMTATATKGRGPDARRNIAVLSGGGEFGAYGAGFFESYLANSGEGVVFDIVTGVSTGALQST
ncbi:MAG: patatin-like phospholipase family protein, partial [Pseudomonadota bacterium]